MQYLALFLQQTQPDPEAIKGIIMAMVAIIPLIILVALIIVMVPFWFILQEGRLFALARVVYASFLRSASWFCSTCWPSLNGR